MSSELRLHKPGAEVFVGDGTPVAEALARTTHLAVGAHPDDVEILALHGILECYGRTDRWFCGVVLADGAQSARSGPYADLSDASMREVRRGEQKKAAVVGEYGAVVLLDYTSAELKDARDARPVDDLCAILSTCRPETVYTHNLADRHDTHVAAVLRVLAACRRVAPETRPARVLGGAVWRDLDWLASPDTVALDVGSREALASALIGVFDSQISGGKRYDLAVPGRRRAHATYDEPRGVDRTSALDLAMDLTPLARDPRLDVASYAQGLLDRFAADVRQRLGRLG